MGRRPDDLGPTSHQRPPATQAHVPRARATRPDRSARGNRSVDGDQTDPVDWFSPTTGQLMIGNLAVQLLVVALAAATCIPFAWVVLTSLKTPGDIEATLFLPGDCSRLTLDNYRALFSEQPIWDWLINSLFLAGAHTVLVVLLCSLGGFALAKYRFVGRRVIMAMALGTMLLPSQILLTSTRELIDSLHLADSLAGVLLPGLVSVFGLFLYSQALKSLPDDLLAAARIDGCGELRLWWEIAMPYVRPMTGAFALLSFMASWHGFIWPQLVLQDPAHFTMPLGLANMASSETYQLRSGVVMAGTVVGVLPAVVLFLLLQREFVAGLASGGVKG